MDLDASLFEVEFISLVFGGDALGRLPDGRVVFVPFVLPGEKAQIRVYEEKRGHARGELVKILTPSRQRIQPLCPHFTVCGGCHYQHVSYSDQLAIKSSILEDTLRRIGGLENPPLQPVVGSPKEWHYRNTVQFHLTAAGKPGYLAPDSHHVVAISECHLPDEALNSLWPMVDMEPVPGLERLILRQGAGGDALLVLEGDDTQAPEFTVDLPLSAVYLGPGGAIVLAGDDGTIIEVAGRSFQVSAESFFQVNTPMAEAMVQYLVDYLPLSPDVTLMDVYCGAGLFSAFCAGSVKRVIGIEVSPAACADFAANLDEFNNVELYEGPAEEVLPALDVSPDIMIVDPPRAGLDRRVLNAILGKKPACLVYVSCDPATLARDARRLINGGYDLESITPFDLFPQTYHIESISIFRLVKPAPIDQSNS
jgi:23S rRNA (uracil1939-C5)-methyltransferase